MLTSGWPGTFIAPAPATRPRSTSARARRSSGSTEGCLARPCFRGPSSSSAFRAGWDGSRRRHSRGGASGEVRADLLADEGVRVVTRDVLLVRLPGLRVGDDRLELCHGILSERDASMRGFHIRLTPRTPDDAGTTLDGTQRRFGKSPRTWPQSRYTSTTARPSAADMVLSSATASVSCWRR